MFSTLRSIRIYSVFLALIICLLAGFLVVYTITGELFGVRGAALGVLIFILNQAVGGFNMNVWTTRRVFFGQRDSLKSYDQVLGQLGFWRLEDEELVAAYARFRLLGFQVVRMRDVNGRLAIEAPRRIALKLKEAEETVKGHESNLVGE